MSWEIFRAEYKKGLNDNEDMSSVIAESYDKCVKTGLSGAGTAPPAPLVAGNVSGLQTMLKACFSSYGVVPLSTSLDTGLKLYWLGGTTAAGALVTNPGITASYIDAQGKLNETIDDTIDQFIAAFNIYHQQVVFTIAATPPLVSVGYNVT
tara:strand:+ start:701 stop:1153 length:453 start_codon:yes stop_codon:yes gene_type:complete